MKFKRKGEGTKVAIGKDPAAVVIGVAAWLGEGTGAGDGEGGDGREELGEVNHFGEVVDKGWSMWFKRLVEFMFVTAGRSER